MTPTGPRTGLAPRLKLEFYAALEGDEVLASKFLQDMADATAADARARVAQLEMLVRARPRRDAPVYVRVL